MWPFGVGLFVISGLFGHDPTHDDTAIPSDVSKVSLQPYTIKPAIMVIIFLILLLEGVYIASNCYVLYRYIRVLKIKTKISLSWQ